MLRKQTTIVIGLLLAAGVASAPLFADIRAYGGIGDGITYNNRAIEAALAAIVESGPGSTLYFPPGTWLAAPFNISFTSNLTVLLDDGATILASNNTADWFLVDPLPSYGTGRDFLGPRFTPFVWVINATGFRLTSNASLGGTIDGQGSVWWMMRSHKTLQNTPGHLFEIMYSSAVEIDNLRFIESPFWTTHIYACDDVHVHDMWIRVSDIEHGVETDGIDPDSSSNVLIEGVDIDTGDDGIAIKSGWDNAGITYGRPSINITVRDAVLSSHQGSNCFTIGSETSGGIANIHASNITCRANSSNGFRVKTAAGRGGVIQNVTFMNSVIQPDVGLAIAINAYYGANNPTGFNLSNLPIVRDINVINVTAPGGPPLQAGDAEGLTNDTVTGIYLADIHLGQPGKAWTCNANVAGTTNGNVQPPPCPQLGG